MNPILMYHYVAHSPVPGTHPPLTVPPHEFDEQLAALRARGSVSVLSDEYSRRLQSGDHGNTVWITFDDGRIDNLDVALPRLVAAGHRATFFVIAEKSLGNEPGFVPLSGLREMLAAGMEIGSHTMTHPRLARLPLEQARREIADSRARLEDALQVPVRAFCHPFGNWNAATVDLVREAGYELATSTIRDNRNARADRWTLRRVMIQPGRTGWRFRYALSPAYHLLHAFKNRRRWTG